MNPSRYPNDAIRLLRVKHVGPRALARAAGVRPNAAVRWFAGTARPEPERRRTIEQAFGVEPRLWDLAPKSRGHRPGQSEEPRTIISAQENGEIVVKSTAESINLDEPGALRLVAIAAVRHAEEGVARVRSTPGVTDGEVRKAERHLTQAAMRLAKIAGELNATEDQRLVGSGRWRAIRRVMLAALEPFPEAKASVERALDEVGAA